MRTHVFFTILLGALLVLCLAACGTKNVGVLDSATLDSGNSTSGVTLGEFEIIRANADGTFDPALNDTLSVRLEDRAGEPALVIGVHDAELVSNVALEVRFDPASTHAVRAEFNGLYGATETIEAAFLQVAGKAAVGQVCVAEPPAALAGDFATVYFAEGPTRSVSAAGGPHSNPKGVDDPVYPLGENIPNLVAESDTEADIATLTWYGAWHRADGNQDGLITVADITPIGFFFEQNVDDNWACMRADYNFDRFITVSDLTPIGVHFDQGTEGYRVEASDDVESPTLTPVQEVAWNGPEASPYSGNQGDAVSGELYPVFTRWQLEFSSGSAFTFDSLAALDDNGNDMVRLHVTPHDNTGDSATSFRDVNVEGGGGGDLGILVIDSYQIRVTNGEGGTGPGDEIFDEDNDVVTVYANAGVEPDTGLELHLYSISGTFNAIAFDGTDNPDNWPEGMEQSDYDAAFTAARNKMEWRIEHDGAAGFRRTADWLDLDSGQPSPITGDPGAGTVFPDDDPESDAAEPEGLVTTYLKSDAETTYPSDSNLEVHVYSPIQYEFGFDAEEDQIAVELTNYGEDPINPETELLLNEPTLMFILFDWGSGGPPAEMALTSMDLHEIDTGSGLSLGAIETFTYIEGVGEPEAGQFMILPSGEDDEIILVKVRGSTLAASAFYAFRFFSDNKWSSINKPAELLGTATPPPPQDLVVVPEQAWPAIDQIQFFYEDPVVRRNPDVYYDFGTGTIVPTDQTAYDDVLKTNGDEFFIQASGGLYPQVAVKETPNPANITSLADNILGVVMYETIPGRLVVDVTVISQEGGVGDPTRTYSFKFFNANGSAVGQGTFMMAPIGSFNVEPTGYDWGVNVWDRDVGELNMRTYDDFFVDGDTIGIDAVRPDVLWFEFGGGWVFDVEQDAEGVYADGDDIDSPNVRVRLVDRAGSGNFYMSFGLRIAGLSAAGNYLAIHALNIRAWEWPGIGAWPGMFDGGKSFDVQLDDPHYAGIEYTYPQPLFVTGTNPNTGE